MNRPLNNLSCQVQRNRLLLLFLLFPNEGNFFFLFVENEKSISVIGN